MSLHPTSKLVTLAWLEGVPGLSAGLVGDTVPDDASTWSTSGYTQLVGIVGGSPGMYVPEREPVATVDLWAVNPDSGLPPWNKANQLAEHIIADTYDTDGNGPGNRVVTANLPSGYAGAYVQAVYVLTEPRPVPNDQGSYARLTMDIALKWVEL